MSRNKREGHYYGWVKGKHIRADRRYRDVYKVNSWFAWREYNARERKQIIKNSFAIV